MIPIIRPFLPPREEYDKYLDGIWKRNWLTNMGPLSSDLEMNLKRHLNLHHLLFVANGTIALQIALKALELKGEIITTPFSFVATTSSIVWEGCRPVFVDIDKNTLNIDPTKIEEAITNKTTAILATHVYGNPCNVKAIDKIAKKFNLRVIYDGAHAFGVNLYQQSLLEYGDISICSLHATKLYHSIEGGLIVTKDAELFKKMAFMRNFGFNGPEAFAELGINGKNSELHAAMGLANLKYIEKNHEKRKELNDTYDRCLKTLRATKQQWDENATLNYAYYTLVFEQEELMLKCIEVLEASGIYTRRYFYPSLDKVLPYVQPVEVPVTDSISRRVLCLPLYYDLTVVEVELICRLLLSVQND